MHMLYHTDNQLLPHDAMLAQYMLPSCVRPSVRPSVCHMPILYQNAKHRITHTTPDDSSATLVFYCQRFRRNSNGVTPTGAPSKGGVVIIGDFRPISRYISKMVQDRDIVTMER